MLLKAMYDLDWQTISGNCDATIYLGGNESETTKWLSEEIGGKKTARILGENYDVGTMGGSNSVTLSGVEVLSMSDLRQMRKDECLVILKGLPMYKGKKYNIKEHPRFKEAEDCYGKFLLQEDEHTKRQLKKTNRKKKPLPVSVRTSINNAAQKEAEECLNNKDSKTGQPLIKNQDMKEAMENDQKLRAALAQVVLDSTGHENVKAEDLLDTSIIQAYSAGV